MMPGMDGFEVCQRIKANPRTLHIPVVMVTALSEPKDRVRGLEAGADDFLTKPVNELALFARVRSLVRLKMMMDEWRLREETCGQFELMSAEALTENDNGNAGQVLLAESSAAASAKICDTLAGHGHKTTVATSAAEALALSKQSRFDLIILSLKVGNDDGLRLVSQMRSQDETRQVPILVVGARHTRLSRAHIGASDYLFDRPHQQSRACTRSAAAAIRPPACLDAAVAGSPIRRSRHNRHTSAYREVGRTRARDRKAGVRGAVRHRPFQGRERHPRP
jgi:two-component system cell cycle response regulator